MKILKRILLDQLEDTQSEFALNMDFVESESTILIHQEYDELVESLSGQSTFIFFPEDILERDFNKRLIDAAYEAGVWRLMIVVSQSYDQKEKDVLKKYLEDYKGFDYLFLEIPPLMDDLFIAMMQGKKHKNISKNSISSDDVMMMMNEKLSSKEFGQETLVVEGVAYENIETYYDIFHNPDQPMSMKIKKEDPFVSITGREPETWDHFVRRKKSA